jgi:hypothetical protein
VSARFSGSYDPADAEFLLKPVELEPMGIEERELGIQAQGRHYSEMIGPEGPPDPLYMEVFRDAMDRNLPRLGADFVRLAALVAARPGPVTLMSIARSGIPAGVVLVRLLRRLFGKDAAHYAFSVIRDRGADRNALEFAASGRPPGSLVFVDGWTGTGVIARELRKSLDAPGTGGAPGVWGPLAVLSDLCGEADLAAGIDDWLIPTCVLNSTVSGLVSRTILSPDLVGPADFHGCVSYPELAPHDVSRETADRIVEAAMKAARDDPSLAARAANITLAERVHARERSASFLETARRRFGVTDQNHVKPGIGEATRVLLRRSPELLIVRDPGDPDVRHAVMLAGKRNVPVLTDSLLAYRAAAIIRKVNAGEVAGGPEGRERAGGSGAPGGRAGSGRSGDTGGSGGSGNWTGSGGQGDFGAGGRLGDRGDSGIWRSFGDSGVCGRLEYCGGSRNRRGSGDNGDRGRLGFFVDFGDLGGSGSREGLGSLEIRQELGCRGESRSSAGPGGAGPP